MEGELRQRHRVVGLDLQRAAPVADRGLGILPVVLDARRRDEIVAVERVGFSGFEQQADRVVRLVVDFGEAGKPGHREHVLGIGLVDGGVGFVRAFVVLLLA